MSEYDCSICTKVFFDHKRTVTRIIPLVSNPICFQCFCRFWLKPALRFFRIAQENRRGWGHSRKMRTCAGCANRLIKRWNDFGNRIALGSVHMFGGKRFGNMEAVKTLNGCNLFGLDVKRTTAALSAACFLDQQFGGRQINLTDALDHEQHVLLGSALAFDLAKLAANMFNRAEIEGAIHAHKGQAAGIQPGCGYRQSGKPGVWYWDRARQFR